MSNDQYQFMRLFGQLPARLTAEQSAWVLNCQPADVPVLVAAKLLKPLGNPSPYAVKYFGTVDLLELIKDRNWLAKVSNALGQHWQKRNAARKQRQPNLFAAQCHLVLSAVSHKTAGDESCARCS